MTRREGTLLAVLAGTMLLSGTPAKAFLGFGEPSADEVYARDTVRLPLYDCLTRQAVLGSAGGYCYHVKLSRRGFTLRDFAGILCV